MQPEIEFSKFLDAVPDAMVIVDRSGRMVTVNEHAARLFGYARQELLDRPVEILVPERYRDVHLSHRAGYHRRPGVRPMGLGLDLFGVTKDGTEFPVEISLSPFEIEGQMVVVAAIRDITDRKKAEVERGNLIREQVARTEAEAANRAKDEFLAVLSHELRTPLQSMMGWAHLLKSGRLDETARARAIEVVVQSIRHQTQLVTDLLDVSRIITGKLKLEMSPLDLAPVIDMVLEAVRPAAHAKGIALSSVLDPQTGPVLGDPDRLRQVVWNLLSNAVKFTSHGGRIDLRLQRHDDRARIVVQDSGRGIAREFLAYIFERFRQADTGRTRMHGGLGLGLAISRHLVALHGGTVTAESAGEGQGATFTVELPLALAPAPVLLRMEGAARHESSATFLNGMTVLVVDDDPDTIELLVAVLREHGASVKSAASAREALQVIDQAGIDVLVSDISMPGEDGYQLIERVRRHTRMGSIPAVALTAYARPEDREVALRAGYHAHLAKPIEPDELVHEIARVAHRV